MSRPSENRTSRVHRLATMVLVIGIALIGVIGCNATVVPSADVPAAASGPATSPPSASAEASATPLGVADLGRALDAGGYRIAEPFSAPFSISVPAGWRLESLGQGEVWLEGPSGGDTPSLYVGVPENVFADPCDSRDGPLDPPVSATVDGIVGAIGQMTGFQAGPITDVVIGAHTGKAFDLTNTVATGSAGCYAVDWLPMWTTVGGGEAATIGGWHEQIWVLDVEGTTVIVDRAGQGVDDVAATLEFGSPVAVLPTAPVATPSAPHLTYVALGDSLLFAAEEDCDGCTSAAVIYGQQMQDDRDVPVEVHNLTMHNGLDSGGLRRYLEQGAKIGRVGEDVFRAVESADIVSVTIGFNDFGSPVATPVVTGFASNLHAILGRIVALRERKPTTILVTQIYNNGGAAWTPVVEAQNEVICEIAEKHDAICVDIYHPFNGPDGSGSPAALGYLGADQTHPSQLGMEVIADALAASGSVPPN